MADPGSTGWGGSDLLFCIIFAPKMDGNDSNWTGWGAYVRHALDL